jgi:hypothetical protein
MEKLIKGHRVMHSKYGVGVIDEELIPEYKFLVLLDKPFIRGDPYTPINYVIAYADGGQLTPLTDYSKPWPDEEPKRDWGSLLDRVIGIMSWSMVIALCVVNLLGYDQGPPQTLLGWVYVIGLGTALGKYLYKTLQP